jgi:signal transduction histidine kinase
VASVRGNQWIDVLLAAVLTGLTLVTAIGRGSAGWLPATLAALSVAPIALRQFAPLVTMGVMLAALLSFVVESHGDIPGSGLGVLIGMFTIATLRPRPMAAVAFAAIFAVLGIAFLTTTEIWVWPEFVQSMLIIVGAWVLGESTRRWAQRAERLAAHAERAAADERVRIARELHDVVSHHMSVISLQAGVSRYLLDTDVPAARTALGTVEDSSREALSEMRRLLEVLHVEDEADLLPQPGLADLDGLVERAGSAGVPIEVTVTGVARALPPGPDLCAYRIVQESLTNVLKHAGAARVSIGLDYGSQTLTLRIVDDGAGPSPGPVGHGIRGMRERAALYGGVLTAGPASGGGFGVVARLPISEVPCPSAS